MAKLAIVEERDEEKYEYVTTFKCWGCDPALGRELPDSNLDPAVCIAIFCTSTIQFLNLCVGEGSQNQRYAIHVLCAPI